MMLAVTLSAATSIDARLIRPPSARPVIIRVVSGRGNYVANNHIVATTEASKAGDAPNSECFSTQVEAIISTRGLTDLDVTAVQVEQASIGNTVLDSGTAAQVTIDSSHQRLSRHADAGGIGGCHKSYPHIG